jgi:hypothetical protein
VRAAALLLLALASLALFDCGASAPARAPAHAAFDEPRWEDVIDTTPELLAIVHPTALRRDRVYGPLLRRVIDLVREQSRVVAETRALDAMEDADEVIVGVRPTAADGADGEVIVVVRGVRADVDPVTLVDADGHALWAPGPAGRVRELIRAESAESPSHAPAGAVAASLFELPGRTWLIASGPARARARGVFAHPLGRPALHFGHPGTTGDDPLAILRIDGPSLVGRVRELQSLGGLATLGHGLEAVTLELEAGRVDDRADLHRTVRAFLSYANADAAALAEVTARDVIGAIGRKKPESLAWLGDATVDRAPAEGGVSRSILVTAPLPARLVYALLHAGSARTEAPPPAP